MSFGARAWSCAVGASCCRITYYPLLLVHALRKTPAAEMLSARTHIMLIRLEIKPWRALVEWATASAETAQKQEPGYRWDSIQVHKKGTSRDMTDNCSCLPVLAFQDTFRYLGLLQIRARPFTPGTNGKSKRPPKTVLYKCSSTRALCFYNRRDGELPIWTNTYNQRHTHCGQNSKPLLSLRLVPMDNQFRLHI